ncbi:TonB family protein [Catenovulum sp. 2E275]|uniref:energy transducer TonB n=1 Tax=Catenovulum sp. 2E275 TaxID=2980497 RepID=UPI0021D29A41|nr:energy transducer TonB [Catenovulum sp. 2E275]MCU4675871.1 TonB family protein [Catenovulum sp. 2E275]
MINTPNYNQFQPTLPSIKIYLTKVQSLLKATVFSLAGLAISFALFVLMHTLTYKEFSEPPATPESIIIPNIVVDKTQPKANEIEKLPPPPKLAPPPQVKPASADNNELTSTNTIKLAQLETPPVDLGNKLFALPANSQASPMFRMEPKYPTTAAMQGIEGWVRLSFDIGLAGEVENIKVLDAEPKRVFDRAAIAALKKWKYKPQLKEGRAIVLTGQSVELKFNLEQN